ncbi:hypothetical protein BKA70DRAFT_1401708 [Coprinopsis sp. MPI-PUGE-AT-0042]|nr:hypothetical protein BKA70DRAFT_1410519 [Coprinopsis sp. MPI-PUGE-AT-0042]KAH6906588.1 hypothetical protein BKA70DRAFT_1401708 [Coprinopsis sp. MPI-PUGE-AT-0042]
MDGYLAWEFEGDTGVNNTSSQRPAPPKPVTTGESLTAPSPGDSSKDASISISTIFHPGSTEVSTPPDCIIVSGDDVLFYLNAHVLSMAGPHTFPLTPLLEEWVTAPGPIAQRCRHLPRNGPHVSQWHLSGSLVQKGTPLYTLLVTQHVPYHPLLVYSTAAQYGIESLAQDASSHLLGVGLEDIDDASACKMGPLYLKRLSLLNLTRIKTLKNIVLTSAPSHTLPKGRRGCSREIQKAMRKEWVHTVTQLTWDAKSSISPHLIKDTCRRAGEDLPCQMCRESWNECADSIAVQWAQVKFSDRTTLVYPLPPIQTRNREHLDWAAVFFISAWFLTYTLLSQTCRGNASMAPYSPAYSSTGFFSYCFFDSGLSRASVHTRRHSSAYLVFVGTGSQIFGASEGYSIIVTGSGATSCSNTAFSG